MKKDLRNMIRWTLRRAFHEHPEEAISLQNVGSILEDVWHDMVKYGEISKPDGNGRRKLEKSGQEEKIEREWKKLADKLKAVDYQKSIDEINKRVHEDRKH